MITIIVGLIRNVNMAGNDQFWKMAAFELLGPDLIIVILVLVVAYR